LIGHIAIGLAAVVGIVPASLVQDSGVPDPGKPAGTGSKASVSVASPTGNVSVSARSVDGAPLYVRRTSPIGGMAIVEVSKTPFAPVLASSVKPAAVAAPVVRADQPAGW
jgi:hypothetical protein